MPRYFHFINGSGNPVWIHTGSVLCLYRNPDGTYNAQCTRSHWTMNEVDFHWLAELLTEDNEEEDGDWWKRGGPGVGEEDE